jgi:hypothetical protein
LVAVFVGSDNQFPFLPVRKQWPAKLLILEKAILPKGNERKAKGPG